MTGEEQAGLFDSQNSDEVTPATDGPGIQPAYVATNRHNLLKILAVRMLMPVEGFDDKYYDDLFRFAPGRIPVLAGGLSERLDSVVASDEHDFPVLLELDVTKLATVTVPTIGDQEDGAPIGTVGALGWAPAGPIPFDVVQRIHFRSDADFEAFTLNEFADVRAVPERLLVTRELFTNKGDQAGVEASLQQMTPPNLPRSLVSVDRRAGALELMALVLERGHAALYADISNGQYPEQASPAARGLASWILWRDVSADADHDGGEEAATATILRTLETIERRKSWRPLEIVKDVRSAIDRELRGAGSASHEPALVRAESILRSDEAFGGFREGGWPILKALLLGLMRPDPERLDADELEKLGADAETRLLTAAAVGALNGRARLPLIVRPELLDDALALWECDRTRTPENPTDRWPTLAREPNADGWLVLGSMPLVKVRDKPEAPASVQRSSEPTTTKDEDVPPVIDLTALLLTEAGAAAAFGIARRHGWWDAVATKVMVKQPAAEVRVRADASADLVLEVSSLVDVSHEIVASRFMELVASSADSGAITAELESVASSVGEPPGTKKASPTSRGRSGATRRDRSKDTQTD
jgi:hypothetical protein